MTSFALQTGAVFADRYAVNRCLKIGGMGAVYEVTDQRTNSARALKVMNPDLVEDPELRSRFEQEARIVGQVESDHLVRTFDAGVDPSSGTPFLVMELLRGEEVGALIKRRGALPIDEALLYLRQAARAVDKTHAAGIVHRDLKPENLFVTQREDGTPCVKVLDFGIAKMVEKGAQSRLTRTAGTPVYMAPEQIQGKSSVGLSVDLYALGQIAYTLVVGEPYWREEAKALEMFPLFSTILEGPKEAARDRALRRMKVELPPAFDGWYARATAANPSDRFATAAELVGLAEAMGQATMRPEAFSMPPNLLASSTTNPAPVVVAPDTEFDGPGAAPVTGATAQPVTTSGGQRPTAPPRQRLKLIAAAALTATLVIVPAAIFLSTRGGDDAGPTKTAGSAGPSATQSSSPAATAAGITPSAVPVNPQPTSAPTLSAERTSRASASAVATGAPSPPRPTSAPTSRPGGRRSIF